MRIRAVLESALTLVLTVGMLAPVAYATSGGDATDAAPTPLQRPPAEAVDALTSDASALEAPPGDPRTGADVIDGDPVASGAHPYVGLVLLVDPATGDIVSSCTGSLIAPGWVLTAAHCLVDVEAAVVALDLVDLNDDADVDRAEVIVADAAAVAPGFTLNPPRDDVGLLRLENPSAVTPVALGGTPDDDRFTGGTRAEVLGWGATDGSGTPTSRLLKGDVRLLAADACYSQFGDLFEHGGMLCAGGVDNDTCFGDSGGPLLVRDGGWLVLGVTSFGDSDCVTGDASGYARVSALRDWIGGLTGIAPRPGSPRFPDVTRDQRHFDAILSIVDADIANGFPDDTFRPTRNVTRAQMASFLARALGLTPSGPPPFDDIEPGYVHADAIAAIAEAGVTTGFDDGTFRPTESVTRAQMASFLARAFEFVGSGRVPFVDVSTDSVHHDAIAAIAEAGISTGFGDGTFRPALQVTRGQMASFLARALDLLVLEPAL